MPDFEALIRHQQLKQPSSNQRLKIVTKQTNKNNTNEYKNATSWIFINYFITGLSGAIIGAFAILFLDINNLLPLELLKIN